MTSDSQRIALLVSELHAAESDISGDSDSDESSADPDEIRDTVVTHRRLAQTVPDITAGATSS